MKNRNKKRRLDGSSFLLAVTIISFSVMYTADIIMSGGKGFAKAQNFLNLSMFNAGLTVVAINMTIAVTIGGIDISVGSMVAMMYMMLARMTERRNIGAFPAILIMLVTGCMFGLVQGFLVTYLRIQPFIVTLAGMFFAGGTTFIISQEMISITNKTSTDIATFKMHLPFGGYPNKKGVMTYPYVYPSVTIALAVLAIVSIVLEYAKFGRPVYATGGNEQPALLLGLNVRRIKLQAYVLDGFPTGLGGPLFCMNTRSGFMEQAKGFEVGVIASSAIGGTLLIGGVGNAIESLFGVLIKGTIESLITFQGTLSSWWVRAAIMALLCFSIVLQNLITALRRRNE